MNVVSFVDFLPEPRFDGISWTRAEIKEAATQDGPYTVIDTVNIGSDADPAHPASRSFTTANAALDSGWYIITFLAAAGGDRSPVAPIHFDSTGNVNYVPTVQQVARKIMSRTRDKFGNLVGTFTINTQPTDTQVNALANDAVTEIADVIGDDIPAALWDDAQNVVALRTAMQIETDFFSEQVATNRSAYPQLQEQYTAALEALQRAVTAAEEGDGTVVDTGPARSPSYDFPAPHTGWGTRW